MYLEVVTDRRSPGARRMLVSWAAAMMTCGYLLPWAVATTRGRVDADLVGLLNLAAGWTVVGWFVALALACRRHRFAGLRLDVTGLRELTGR